MGTIKSDEYVEKPTNFFLYRENTENQSNEVIKPVPVLSQSFGIDGEIIEFQTSDVTGPSYVATETITVPKGKVYIPLMIQGGSNASTIVQLGAQFVSSSWNDYTLMTTTDANVHWLAYEFKNLVRLKEGQTFTYYCNVTGTNAYASCLILSRDV